MYILYENCKQVTSSKDGEDVYVAHTTICMDMSITMLMYLLLCNVHVYVCLNGIQILTSAVFMSKI